MHSQCIWSDPGPFSEIMKIGLEMTSPYSKSPLFWPKNVPPGPWRWTPAGGPPGLSTQWSAFGKIIVSRSFLLLVFKFLSIWYNFMPLASEQSVVSMPKIWIHDRSRILYLNVFMCHSYWHVRFLFYFRIYFDRGVTAQRYIQWVDFKCLLL